MNNFYIPTNPDEEDIILLLNNARTKRDRKDLARTILRYGRDMYDKGSSDKVRAIKVVLELDSEG